jgi:hypothetical protein
MLVQSEQYILLSLALGAFVVALYYCRVVKLCILHQIKIGSVCKYLANQRLFN